MATVSRESLETLVAAAADADRPLPERHLAFGALVREFQDMALACAAAALGDHAEAEDAAQEAFLVAWQRLPQLREPAAFPGWLQRIVVTQCRRRTRGRRPPPLSLTEAGEAPSPADGPLEAAARHEESVWLRAALAALPETERTVAVLSFVQVRSRSDVAAMTGLSVVQVKKRLASARARLRERLTMREEDRNRAGLSGDLAARVLAFTKLFSRYVDEGYSLVRCLDRLTADEPDPEFRAAIEAINRDLQSGRTLSEAMRAQPRYFSDACVRSIREGEIRAELDEVLQGLAAGTYRPGVRPLDTRTFSQVAAAAAREARSRGQGAARLEHLTLAMLDSGASLGGALLRERDAAASSGALRRALERRLTGLPTGRPDAWLSPTVEAVQWAARAGAERRGRPSVDTLDLLHALLAAPVGPAGADVPSLRRLLRRQGVTARSVAEAMAAPSVGVEEAWPPL